MALKKFEQNIFDVDKEFFIIDSYNLGKIKDKLYGYCIKDSSVITDVNSLDTNNIPPDGTYIYIKNDGDNIYIKQDYLGCYGIYIYQQDEYFAISNSFLYLIEHLKGKYNISINEDYTNAFLSKDIYSLSYKETMINEIKLLERNAHLIIDKNSKTFKVEYIDYKENSIEVDSPEFFTLLDEWFFKWTNIIRKLKMQTNNIIVDLSGGFDSRLTFLLFLASGINMDEVCINVFKDKLHTHKEDYEIAKEISEYYHFKLNNKQNCLTELLNYSLKDTINICEYLKLSLHKQFYLRKSKNKEPFFIFGGQGGECVRHYWNMNEENFIKKNQHYYFENNLEYKLNNSVAKIIKDTCNYIRNNSSRFNRKFDESYLTINLFRDTYCRQHFGKFAVDQYFTNSFCFFPLLDISLNTLKLSTSECQDKNLLISIIYTRYVKDILNFKFDSNRFLNDKTLSYANMLNMKYPYHETKKEIISCSNKNINYNTAVQMENQNCITTEDMNKYFLKKYNTVHTKAIFKTLYNKKIYNSIMNDVKTRKRFPLQNFYPVIAIRKVSDAVMLNPNKDYKFLLIFIVNYMTEALFGNLSNLIKRENFYHDNKCHKRINIFGIKFSFRDTRKEIKIHK